MLFMGLEIHQQYSRVYFSFGIVLMSPLSISLNSIIQTEKDWGYFIQNPIKSFLAFIMFILGYNLVTMSVEVLEGAKHGKST